MSIEIVSIQDEKTRYRLNVDVNEEGDLVLSARDTSPHIEQMFLRDEYEYWYTVKSADVPRLIAELLRERFVRTHGISTSTAFKAWCKEHDIPYAFACD